jgi:hypothetical protein
MMMVMMVIMMVVMVMVTMCSGPDADGNTGAMMMVVMMVSNHDLGSPGAAALCQTLIVGFQQRQGVGDRIQKVAIAGCLRDFRPARRCCLGSGHRGEGSGRSQQAG